MSKIVKSVPPAQYGSLRDPWYDEQLDGNIRQIEPADWQGRFKTNRSCATSLRQAAERRGLDYTISVRGEDVYVEPTNGMKPKPVRKAAVRKTQSAVGEVAYQAPKAAAKKAPVKKAAAKRRPPKQAA